MKTNWTYATYDVWGNEKDGFEVNDVFRGNCEFKMDSNNDREILRACKDYLGLKSSIKLKDLEIEGDDQVIYVNSAKDCYPLGEFNKSRIRSNNQGNMSNIERYQ